MSKFEEILTSSGEELLKKLYRSGIRSKQKDAARAYARNLGLTHAQMVCALGFNAHIGELTDVIQIVGFDSYESLARERNEYFMNDVYDRLGIKDVLAIYLHIPRDPAALQIIQYLLERRLENIETRIEETVNSVVIERYKKEVRAIYSDGVAQIEFTESRLEKTQSGFRALLNEVGLIAEARLIPVGDLFFRDTILPEEKRRLISKGLIPKTLVEQRLGDEQLSAQERLVLEDQIRLMPG